MIKVQLSSICSISFFLIYIIVMTIVTLGKKKNCQYIHIILKGENKFMQNLCKI